MYVLRFILIVGLATLACCLTGIYFDGKYKKNQALLFFNTTDTLLDKTKQYDVVLMGNSRVHFGLNPYYIDSITGLRSYNFGIGGSGPALLQLSTELYLQNHPAPRYVVIGSDVSMMVAPEGIYNQFHFFYYLHNSTVYRSYKKYHRGIVLAKYLPFLKYSFFNEYNRRQLFKNEPAFEKFDHNIYKGFINLSKNETSGGGLQFGVDTLTKPISNNSIQMMKDIIARWKQAGSTVILLSPPMSGGVAYRKKYFFATADTLFAQIAAKLGVAFVEAGKELAYPDKYFMDDLHLNEPGTRIFSKQVGTFIHTLHNRIQ